MAVKLSPFGPKPQFEDANGNPDSGYQLFFYAANSSTKQNTYTDSGGGTANSNPIILNSLGMPANQIWFTSGQTYKVILASPTDTDPPAAGITLGDDLSGINDTTTTLDQWVSGPAPTYVSATQFTLVGDQTTAFHAGRRLKTTNSSGTIYSVITVSAFTTLTTVTVVNDSGSLDSGLSAVSYGLLSADNTSIPGVKISGLNWTHSGDITMSAASIIQAEGADVASAATTDIWATDGNTRHITGSTGPITSFGTAPQAGAWMKVIFDSTPTLTHSANLNIVNGGVDITVVAGSVAYVYADTTTQLDVLYLGVATQAEAEAGTQNASLMTPLRTKQAIDALGSSITILAEQALTSGTSKDFTIPSGAKRVTINIVGGSTNGNTNWQIQLGDAGGIEATGYLGSCQTGPTTAISTTAMLITASYSGTGILHGSVILSLEDASDFTWVSHSTTSRSDNAQVDLGAFSKSLSAELTTVRLTTVTPNTFDAGVASGSSE